MKKPTHTRGRGVSYSLHTQRRGQRRGGSACARHGNHFSPIRDHRQKALSLDLSSVMCAGPIIHGLHLQHVYVYIMYVLESRDGVGISLSEGLMGPHPVVLLPLQCQVLVVQAEEVDEEGRLRGRQARLQTLLWIGIRGGRKGEKGGGDDSEKERRVSHIRVYRCIWTTGEGLHSTHSRHYPHVSVL